MPFTGRLRIKRFWRYIAARYGAYPVTWCVAGEAIMPYYLSEDPEAESARQKEGWTRITRYLRAVDGHRNLVTIHPGSPQYGREQVDDPSVLDFEMLQPSHYDMESVAWVIEGMEKAVNRQPVMPVIQSEMNYEGIMGRCWQNVQRLGYYHSLLRGAAGFTYGANGIWQVNSDAEPYGASPHGGTWGNTPWREAAQLPGGRQIPMGGYFLQKFPFWELEPHPEWVDPPAPPRGWPGFTVTKENNPYGAVAVGIPEKLRVIYFPLGTLGSVNALEREVRYEACYFDPRTGEEYALGQATPDEAGRWTPPPVREMGDWLLVLALRNACGDRHPTG